MGLYQRDLFGDQQMCSQQMCKTQVHIITSKERCRRLKTPRYLIRHPGHFGACSKLLATCFVYSSSNSQLKSENNAWRHYIPLTYHWLSSCRFESWRMPAPEEWFGRCIRSKIARVAQQLVGSSEFCLTKPTQYNN